MENIISLIKTIPNKIEQITETTTKTVASSTTVDPSTKDFASLHEALRWAEKVRTIGAALVILQLDEGVHVLGGEGEFDDWNWNYYKLSDIDITIVGDTDTWDETDLRDNYIITIDSYDDGDSWGDIIDIYGVCTLRLKGLVFDATYNGYPYTNLFPFNSWEKGGEIVIDSVDIKNTYYSVSIMLGYLSLRKVNLSNNYIGLNFTGIRAYMVETTFTNIQYGILSAFSEMEYLDLVFTDCKVGYQVLRQSRVYGKNITATDFKANGYVMDVRYQSICMHTGYVNASSTLPFAHAIHADENSKLFFDNAGGDAINITGATVGITSDSSYIGMEFNIPITMTNVDNAFQVHNDGQMYLRQVVPTFINVTTEYNVPLNTQMKTGMIRTENVDHMTSLYDNTISGLNATTEKGAIDELAQSVGDIATALDAINGEVV